MARTDILKKQQARFKEDIAAMLDSYLIGTVAKSPSMSGHNLTTKAKLLQNFLDLYLGIPHALSEDVKKEIVVSLHRRQLRCELEAGTAAVTWRFSVLLPDAKPFTFPLMEQ